jgi:hypothetical protein
MFEHGAVAVEDGDIPGSLVDFTGVVEAGYIDV